VQEVVVVGALLVGCGSAAGGGSPTHSATPTLVATPSASIVATPTPYPLSSAPVDVTVTGPQALTVSAFSTDPTYAQCAAGQLGGYPLFGVVAAIGEASADVGDVFEVEISALPGDGGAVYSGPGTYEIDYDSVPASAAYDLVDIAVTGGTPVLQMWKGSITVNADQTSASFNGTYGTESGMVWSTDGTLSGSVACVPGTSS
jgi:hypothetical protein